MKKYIFSFLFLGLLSSCSNNYPSYYLNDLSVREDLQSQPTSEVVFNNIVYAKMLNKETISRLFSSELKNKTIIFFKAKNVGKETSFFNLKNATISIKDEEEKTKRININKLVDNTSIDLNNFETYSNPFKNKDIAENTFEYNLNNKVLSNFALKPNESKSGFIIFEKNHDAENINFYITTGSSIYTAREQQINLDK